MLQKATPTGEKELKDEGKLKLALSGKKWESFRGFKVVLADTKKKKITTPSQNKCRMD